ncbi:MAG: hypothetical protein RBR86_01705 [Pseudobdellovibrionaceae bacterium]|jgi:hypothetical protein|nr:hypothetical protein [Pseudobdellovibrionaceae bacterium]
MQLSLPYIASQGFRRFGIGLFFISILGLGGLVIGGQGDGRILNEVKPTNPIKAPDMLSPDDLSSRLTKDENGRDVFRDDVEFLDLSFDPVHLSPDMGKVLFSLVIHEGHSAVPEEFSSPSLRYIGKGTFGLIKTETQEEAAHSKIDSRLFDGRVQNGQFFVPKVNDVGDAQAQNLAQNQAILVMSAMAREAGDFYLKASLEKLKYSYKIEDVTLVLTSDRRGFDFNIIMGFILGIFISALVLQVTTPPERRVKNRWT